VTETPAIAAAPGAPSPAAHPPRRFRMPAPSRSALIGTTGVVGVLAVWTVIAVAFLAGKDILPTPLAVVKQMWDDRDFYRPNIATTLSEAAQGWLWGNLAAIAAGAVFVAVPLAERVLLRLAIASYCMPVIAIAPILQIVLGGNEPKVVLAALSVFFTTLVATMMGLRSADRGSIDMVRAFGGGPWLTMVKVRGRAALPGVFSGLRIAAPAAVLGAIVGEYLGGQSGLGVALIAAQQSLNVPRAWGLAFVGAAVAGIGYAVTAGIGRLATPWATAGMAAPELWGGTQPAAERRPVATAARAIGSVVASAVLALALWSAFIRVLDLSPYFAKYPWDVWEFLTRGPAAPGNREILWSATITTLSDAGLGFAAGTAAALLLAIVCTLVPGIGHGILPVSLILRSVPIVAMAPLLTLLFGRGLLGVTVIAGIVTFFPTFVNVLQALGSVSDGAISLMRAYHASAWATLAKVRLPTAAPAIFASARIAGPGALLGATLAEWLATGRGLGFLMLDSTTASNFSMLWAAVVVITLLSAITYSVMSAAEAAVRRRLT
jgi:sulfonate transport system permease protein